MASLDRDPVFAAMADLAAEQLSSLGSINNHAMMGYLLFQGKRIGDELHVNLLTPFDHTFRIRLAGR
ncbi:hypothetical protein FPZ49_05380 [Paenibacillus cremeus]|uniref:Uncharacterized protein n=2 Tax=Paenibacillus cremeus TaxID=2163881 RepID=A0A559KFK6_9BACL|nr:hypothetical protein FPZ49_05380 [Paenibacillus cremeus]